MITVRRLLIAGAAVAAIGLADAAWAQNYPAPVQANWIAPDFVFHTGETMPELRIAYTTVGDPSGEPVLLLHGTGGSASAFLNANFADVLFGPGQPLDATRYYIIMPDAIGSGGSAKPSDGLGPNFPRYNYDDQVSAQYRLVAEGLGIDHLRLVMGNSQGGMHTWLWGVAHPDFMDALVPMASQPTAMSGRNWMLRRLMVEIIRADPAYNGGNYTTQPASTRLANVFFGVATNGGTLRFTATAPTADAADAMVDMRLAAPFTTDANDFIWSWLASRDYDPSAGLGSIRASVLLINSADDERNPPETGLTEQALRQIPNAQLYLIPATDQTFGHNTTARASFYVERLRAFLNEAPQR